MEQAAALDLFDSHLGRNRSGALYLDVKRSWLRRMSDQFETKSGLCARSTPDHRPVDPKGFPVTLDLDFATCSLELYGETPSLDPKGNRLAGIRHGTPTRCDRRTTLLVRKEGKLARIVVECGCWACRHCARELAYLTALKWMLAFTWRRSDLDLSVDASIHIKLDAVGTIFTETFYSSEQASNAVQYATRLGYRAVAVPQDNGTSILLTTQARRTAEALERGTEQRFIELTLNTRAVYTAEGDEGGIRRLRPNRHLQAVLDIMEGRTKTTADAREEDTEPVGAEATPDQVNEAVQDDEEPVEVAKWTPELGAFLDGHSDLLGECWRGGECIRWREPDPATDPAALVVEFRRIWHGAPRVTDTRLLHKVSYAATAILDLSIDRDLQAA